MTKKDAFELAKDVANNVKIQDKAADLLSMVFPYLGLEKKAVDIYVKEIERSSLSPQAKAMAILNTKTTIRNIKSQMSIAEKAVQFAKEGTKFDSSGYSVAAEPPFRRGEYRKTGIAYRRV